MQKAAATISLMRMFLRHISESLAVARHGVECSEYKITVKE